MSKKILIVDDAQFIRMSIAAILEQEFDAIFYEAGTGIEAVAQYARHKPDLVIMDITMPDMDGVTAVKKIKEADPDANIIMCSSMGQQSFVVEAIQAGAKDFIVKPFKAAKVLSSVHQYLETD